MRDYDDSIKRVINFLKELANAITPEEHKPYPEAYGKTPPDTLDINRAIGCLEEDTEDYEEKFNLDELGME